MKLELPATSAFRLPASEAAFEDGLLVSVGNSGSLFARHGELTYHSYEPAMSLEPVWSVSPKVALLLKGSPEPAGDVVAEELYEVTSDPAERVNLADKRFEDLVGMRRRMGDWLAEYGDGPEHERYEYTLAFARPTEVSLFGPRNFSVQADGAKATEHSTRALVKGNVIRIRDEERPLGVVDVSGDIVEEKLIEGVRRVACRWRFSIRRSRGSTLPCRATIVWGRRRRAKRRRLVRRCSRLGWWVSGKAERRSPRALCPS